MLELRLGAEASTHVESREPVDFRFAPLTDKHLERITRSLSNRVSGSFSSLLENGPLLWRSPAELAALSLFELDLRIESIETNPEVATVWVGDRWVDHIPAFRLRKGTTELVIDLVGDSFGRTPERIALTTALKRAYETRRIRYGVLRRADVKAEPRQRNARLVLRSRRYAVDPQTALAITATLSADGMHTVGSVVAANQTASNVREAVYALAARRRIAIDLWATEPEGMAVSLAPGEKRP
jgi:hypothetical protein